MGGVADPKKHAHPYMCYFTERGRFALKGVGINRGESQKLGSPGAPPPLDSPCLLSHQIWSFCIKGYTHK